MLALLLLPQVLADISCLSGGTGASLSTGVATYPVGDGSVTGLVAVGSDPIKQLVSLVFGTTVTTGFESNAGWKIQRFNTTHNVMITWNSVPKQVCRAEYVERAFTGDFSMCVGKGHIFSNQLPDYKITPTITAQRWQQMPGAAILAVVPAADGIYPLTLTLAGSPLGFSGNNAVMMSFTASGNTPPPDQFWSVPGFCS